MPTKQQVFVRGDVAIDWLLPDNEDEQTRYLDPEKYPPLHRMGGAWYYAQMIDASLREVIPPEQSCDYYVKAHNEEIDSINISNVKELLITITHRGGAGISHVYRLDSPLTITARTKKSHGQTWYEICLPDRIRSQDSAIRSTIETIIKDQKRHNWKSKTPDDEEGPRPVDISLEILNQEAQIEIREGSSKTSRPWRFAINGLISQKRKEKDIRPANATGPVLFHVVRAIHNTSILTFCDAESGDEASRIYIRSQSIYGDRFESITGYGQLDEKDQIKRTKIGDLYGESVGTNEVFSYNNRSVLGFHRDSAIYKGIWTLRQYERYRGDSPSKTYRIETLRGYHRLRDGLNRPRLLIESKEGIGPDNQSPDVKLLRNDKKPGSDFQPYICIITDYGQSFRNSPSRAWENYHCSLLSSNQSLEKGDRWSIIRIGGEFLGSDVLRDGSFWQRLLCNDKSPPQKKKVAAGNGPAKKKGNANSKAKAYSNRRIFVIGIHTLRKGNDGFRIKRGGSWEQSLKDIAILLRASPKDLEKGSSLDLLLRLCQSGIVLIRMGMTAVVWIGDRGKKIKFFFDPDPNSKSVATGGHSGHVMGSSTVLVSSLVRSILSNDKGDAISDGIMKGIKSTQRFFNAGYGEDSGELLTMASKNWIPTETFAQNSDWENIRCEEVPLEIASKFDEWSLVRASMHEKNRPPRRRRNSSVFSKTNCSKPYWNEFVLKVALDIVENGIDKAFNCANKPSAPLLKYGKLTLIAKEDIEIYRPIYNSILNHLHSKFTKPMSIAVFGEPGTGKSFAIKQMAESIGDSKLNAIELNVAQMSNKDDLDRAFVRIVDVCARGSVPLVFFDEFDSSLNGRLLGWLKYFLEPMQDGIFRHHGIPLTIGKAIFIFAGGTSTTMQDFVDRGFPYQARLDPGASLEKEAIPEKISEEVTWFGYPTTESYILGKGETKQIDFISRIRLGLDVPGINTVTRVNDERIPYLRRAVLLRSLLESRSLVEREKCLVGRSVISDLLTVKEYLHGARSMEAVIQMCVKYDGGIVASTLPSGVQMRNHISEFASSPLVFENVIE